MPILFVKNCFEIIFHDSNDIEIINFIYALEMLNEEKLLSSKIFKLISQNKTCFKNCGELSFAIISLHKMSLNSEENISMLSLLPNKAKNIVYILIKMNVDIID